MPELTLDHTTTALVLIDLQRGITAGQTAPHAAADVIARAARLIAACRPRGVSIVLVRVDPGPDGVLFPRPQADQPRPPMAISADWAELVPELVLYNTAKIDAVPASLRNFKGNPTNAGPFWNVHEWELTPGGSRGQSP